MQIYSLQTEVQEFVQYCKQNNQAVGFVPTMGCLHAGHLSLIKQAKAENDIVIVSIFVNPTQFSPNEDLDKYPKPFEQDKDLLIDLEVDALFHPMTTEMYGDDTGDVKVNITDLVNKLCGKYRLGHFEGVLTIVAKLFKAVPATRAYFGAKDWQQQLVIRKMVTDTRSPNRNLNPPNNS